MGERNNLSWEFCLACKIKEILLVTIPEDPSRLLFTKVHDWFCPQLLQGLPQRTLLHLKTKYLL